MGFFGSIKNVLKKTSDGFSQKLNDLFKKNKIGEDFYEELEELLIASDVSAAFSVQIVERIRDVAIKEKIKDKDYVVELLKTEITAMLDGCSFSGIETPAVIMLLGVNGVGKTTTVGKLASYFCKEGKSVTIAAADTFRAAASEQLDVWAKRADVRIVKSVEGSDPSAVVFDALSSVKAKNTDVLLIDTAGRLHVKANLMEELKKMSRIVAREYPNARFYKWIVLDATTGQNAVSQVKSFDEAVGLDGIVLTKLDGTAKGGFVLPLVSGNVPVVFVGTGEGLADIAPFSAEEYVSALF